VQAVLLDRFYQVCPKCGRKTWRMVTSKKLTDRHMVESTKRTWSRGGNWPVDEPFVLWVYTYDVSRKCKECGHQWTEKVTKQRPW
jgi:uncharacterized Zn finger protein